MLSTRDKNVLSWIYTLIATAAALSFAWPAFAADNGDVIIVEGICPSDQHADLGGSCVCNDSTQVVVDFECAPDPGQFFGEFGDILVDACEFLGICGGGGGGGNPNPPEPDPEGPCSLLEAACNGEYAQCAAEAFEKTERCASDAAFQQCRGGLRGMVFPGGARPDCRVVSKTGRLFCAFPDPLQNAPFVGDLDELLARCIDDWVASGELTDEVGECQRDAALELEQCYSDVLDACSGRKECPDVFPPTTLTQGTEPGEPEHSIFLLTKVRTRGETAIEAEAFVRNATKNTCYWHLTAKGTQPPEGTLYCKAGEAWDEVGASRFLMADGNDYLADGACGVATQDGVASGSATFHWKVERDESGALLDAKMKSVAGHIVGSLDGEHPYYGDCKVTGKAIEEREVPGGLLELVRERR
jgi:hypothetical protein